MVTAQSEPRARQMGEPWREQGSRGFEVRRGGGSEGGKQRHGSHRRESGLRRTHISRLCRRDRERKWCHQGAGLQGNRCAGLDLVLIQCFSNARACCTPGTKLLISNGGP